MLSKQTVQVRPRCTWRWWTVWFAGALLLTWGEPGFTQDPEPITKVEEDWELVIGTPDPESNAPQVFIVNSPVDNLDGTYSVFEINNLSLPDYYGGGLQLQTWSGEDSLSMRYHSNLQTLSKPGEVVKFTTQIRVLNNSLRFRVLNGTSDTWGTFGGTSLSLSTWTNLADLSSYTPETSARCSRVGFAGNRVQTLELKRVRYYSGTTLKNTVELSRVVHDRSLLGE